MFLGKLWNRGASDSNKYEEEHTVKKYGGSVTAGVRDNWFELRILIPLHVV